MSTFADLGVAEELVVALEALGIRSPSPVQRLAIPAFLAGKPAVAVARTGSGKTFAFGVPLVQRLRAVEASEGAVSVAGRPRGVVLTSTRELVVQTTRVLKGISHGARQRVRMVSGGELPGETKRRLAEPFDILVANPPRLAALLKQGLVDLSDVRIAVVDEVDTLLAPGQRPPVEAVLAASRQAELWWVSATLPEPIRHWLSTRPVPPAVLWSKDAHTAPDTVTTRNIPIKPAQRADAASDLLTSIGDKARGIVFCNRRETADAAGAALAERGHAAVIVHGGLLPRERKAALERFREGEGRVLVTTELAGRGLDLVDLAFVLNWELPERASDYVHRVGRVGRMGRKGKVFNLVTDRDRHLIGQVERLAAGGTLDTGEPLRSARTRKTTAQGAREATARRKKSSAPPAKQFKG
ncbi:MAG: DEAD/DEAH box helicase [Deltaproteobacteria bacterium]|nr:DEAD/DEAH box helicase [Deltaproteobacteria bacterium]